MQGRTGHKNPVLCKKQKIKKRLKPKIMLATSGRYHFNSNTMEKIQKTFYGKK